MIVVAAAAWAAPDATELEGLTIERIGGPGGLALRAATVAGVDGGTTSVEAEVRATYGRVAVAVSLPFATFRTPGGRDASIGNLGLLVLVTRDTEDPRFAWGIGLQVPIGRAYTWVDDPTALWPQAGLDLSVTGVRPGPWALAYRLAAGFHVSPGYEPVPPWWVQLAAAGAVDRSLSDRVGLVAELAIGWWDPSPADLGVLLRAEPLDGLHLRAGLTAPVSAFGGVRELTLRYEVTSRW